MKNFFNNLLAKAWYGFKWGRVEPILPEYILKIERNVYVRIFKFLGTFFIVISGAIKQYNTIMYCIILSCSLVYTIYRLILTIIILINLYNYLIMIAIF